MRQPFNNLDVAIAHKDYDTRGGGEVFAQRFAELLDCPLYVGRRNQTNEPDDDAIDIREIPLERWERWAIDRGGVTRAGAYMVAWQRASAVLKDYDLVITSGNEPLWYVPPDEQTVIAYTHSTPRFMYDLFPRRAAEGLSLLECGYNTVQRTLYQMNTPRPDLWVANSDIVARRISRYQHVDDEEVRVVYPPVDVDNYHPDAESTSEYYLHLGRLAGHKRVGEAVRAANECNAELVIAGTGPEEDRLRALADETVTFLGFVDEERKRELLSGARAVLYPPANEDFGMVPIEAMAAGTPVIGVREGFTKYQIQDGKNGVLYDRGDGQLAAALDRFEQDGVAWSPDRIASFADSFGIGAFECGIIGAIEDAQQRAAVEPDWEVGDGQRVEAVADGGEES